MTSGTEVAGVGGCVCVGRQMASEQQEIKTNDIQARAKWRAMAVHISRGSERVTARPGTARHYNIRGGGDSGE